LFNPPSSPLSLDPFQCCEIAAFSLLHCRIYWIVFLAAMGVVRGGNMLQSDFGRAKARFVKNKNKKTFDSSLI